MERSPLPLGVCTLVKGFDQVRVDPTEEREDGVDVFDEEDGGVRVLVHLPEVDSDGEIWDVDEKEVEELVEDLEGEGVRLTESGYGQLVEGNGWEHQI